MTLVRFAMPYYDCVQRPPGFVRSALQEAAKQANVADNFVDVVALKIPVRQYEWLHALGKDRNIITDGATDVANDLIVTTVPHHCSKE